MENLVAAEVWTGQIVTSSITKLNFKNNNLTTWPAFMCERVSTNVTKLSLATNALGSLPVTFGGLVGLVGEHGVGEERKRKPNVDHLADVACRPAVRLPGKIG